jgi:putative transposase
LTVVDLITRECLAIEANVGLTGRKVARILDTIAAVRGYPMVITMDNGSEFYSKEMDYWAFIHGVRLDFIRPGKPLENAFIESFNRRLRDECLNGEIFVNLDAAKPRLLEWKRDYNETRPHSSLGDVSPARFAAKWLSEGPRKADFLNPQLAYSSGEAQSNLGSRSDSIAPLTAPQRRRIRLHVV